MLQNKIVWMKWLDPFDVKDDDEEVDDDLDTENEDYKNFNLSKDFKSAKRTSHSGSTGPMLVGPMGVIPINEHTNPSKLYEFWMAHTNFSITKDIKNKMENIDGIETLDIFTRYRCRIGIGKAFDSEEVKKTIEEVFCSSPKQVVIDKLGTFRDFLNKKYKNWLVGINAKGKREIHNGEIKDLTPLEKQYKEIYKNYEEKKE